MSQGLKIKIPALTTKLHQKVISPGVISPTHTTPRLFQRLRLAHENMKRLNKESAKIPGIKLFEPIELVEDYEQKPIVRFIIENPLSSHLH